MESLDYYLQTLSTSARARVISHNNGVAIGSDTDWTTPLIKRKKYNVTAQRQHIRDEVLNWISDGLQPWLLEVERQQAEKIGPYSIRLPYDERIADIKRYWSQANTEDSVFLKAGFEKFIKRLPRGLKPTTVAYAYSQMPNGTNLGAPFFTSDARYRDDVFEIARDVTESDYEFSRRDPAILFWRGQPRGLKEIPKQRVVWGYPHWLTILELQLQEAALPALQALPMFSAWVSSDRVDKSISKIISQAGQDILSVDFSGFDASVPKILIQYAFEAVRYMFDASAHRLIDFVEQQFLHMQLLTPAGIWSGRDGGIPSGSGVTNWIGSFCQGIGHQSVATRLGYLIRRMLLQGDDGVVDFDSPWSPVEYEQQWFDMFGMQMSATKGGVSRDTVYYLQNVHTTKYRPDGFTRGVRPIMRVLNGMLSYEQPVSQDWSGADDTIRWWQQGQNSKWHPKLQFLAEFLYDNDFYSRDYEPDQVVALAGGLPEVKSALKQDGFPYGKEPLEGLNEFRFVQEIQRIRLRMQ